jgi:hypothetical protein
VPHARSAEGTKGGKPRADGARLPKLPTGRGLHAFLATGTGVPATLMFTEPSDVRVVKNRVFQSSPPKPTLVVAGCPWTIRPVLSDIWAISHTEPVPALAARPSVIWQAPAGSASSIFRGIISTLWMVLVGLQMLNGTPLGRGSTAVPEIAFSQTMCERAERSCL